ncbi:amino acid adenylation domain-containing protein [Streptomyces sp. NPDC000594]|uniref:amino acid adenylation domain-containing protein n=1 Tax=Streptomyces sp. NPDC000594 TaxID=3154261 RepID=UPI00332B233F
MAPCRTFPLTSYQRDIWVAESRTPNDPQYNLILDERIDGTVDTGALREALARVLGRHDALRLRFGEDDGVPFQWIADPAEAASVQWLDLSGEDDPAGAWDAWREASLWRPFRLLEEAPVMAAVVRESPTVLHVHVKFHHLAADGWTANALGVALWETYALLTGDPDARQPQDPPASWRELADRDTAYRASPAYAEDLAFHRERLAGVVPALFPRGGGTALSGPGRRHVHHTFTLDAALVRGARERGGSPFAYLTAALAVLLTRLHRSDEVVLGVPFLNRPSAAERATAGHCANNLPLRIPVPQDASLGALAGAVGDRVRELRAHERLPLGDILRDLPADSAGERPLFDVNVSYLRFPRPGPLAGAVRDTLLTAPLHARSVMMVGITSYEDDSDLRIDLYCARDVFDGDLPGEALGRQLTTLLRAGLAEPDRPAVALPLLDGADRARVVRAQQGPTVPYRSTTLHALFEERAARTPDRAAVTSADGTRLGYAELDSRANRIAHALRGHGIGAGDRVAVLLERGPLTLPALLGVLKSGAAYVPVDPGYPAERIAFLLSDSRARAVLTGPAIPADLPGDVLPLRADLFADEGPDGPVEPVAGPHDLAYVIYTSGSTGRPKGAMVEHHSVVNRLAWMQRRYPLGPGDTLLQKTPVSFDVSVWELFWWAVEGAGLALLEPGGERDPRTILRTVAEHGVSVLHFVPSMLGPFLDLLEERPGLRAEAAGLRQVFCSGEALPPARVEQFARVLGTADGGGPRLTNLYGPTEATVDVSYHDCPTVPGEPVPRVPIGRPVDNTGLYILDPADRLLPPGYPGELCVGGVQVARGYLERPGLTEEKFTDDPFRPGGRMYRTGDLARLLADGSIEYLGRIDGQVKIRGNRVELGEVQSALTALPGVRDAVVVDLRDEPRGVRLAAYCVTDEELDPAALRAELGRGLPEYMIPAHFLRIDAVPLTPNGKADRRALPAPDAGAATGPHPYTAPRDATEETLAAVWGEVLGAGRVGVHDDYFALGGDSILMLRVRALAARRGFHFDLSDLVRNPTVAALAPLTKAAPVTGPDAVRETEPAPFALVSRVDRARLQGRQDAVPVSRLQLGLIYHSVAEQDSAVYRDVFRYSFGLRWDEASFTSAYDLLTTRHPVLRSSFDLGGLSEPMRIVHPEVDRARALSVVDLRSAGAPEAEAAIAAHVEERRRFPYVFDRPPLHHLRVHPLPESVELVFSFHHALLDGGSVATLVQELLQDYVHLLGGEVPAVCDAPRVAAAHHILAEREALRSEEARAYWTGRLTGAPPALPTAFRPHESPGDREQITRRVDLPEDLTAAVRAFSRTHTLPVKSVLFAAHVLVLRLFSGSADVVTGLVTHGRPDREGAERMTGLFLNTLPIRVAPGEGDGSWLEAVREAFRQEQESHPYRRYPLSAIQEDLGRPVLDTAFNYIHFRQLTEVRALPGVRMLDFRTWEETNFALLVNAVTDPGDRSLWLRVDHAARIFTPDQAELYGTTFLRVLRRVVEHPQEPVGFTFLAAPVDGVRGRATPGTPDVVRAFAARVARSPEAVAVVHGGRRWSYAELDAVADRAARRLRALGAGPGSRVGVALGRAPETVAVLLGVLRAGAAVVPLDPSYPQERLADMIGQARPVTVVTRSARDGGEPGTGRITVTELLDGSDPAGAGGPGTEPLPGATGDGVAYILFTSGSTGVPKGVEMPHRSLASLVAWQNRLPSGVVGGVTLQYAPLSFDVSFQEIFSTLCGGGTLLLVSEEERRDPRTLLRLLDRERVERLYLPYVALQQLAETARALGTVPRSLKAVLSSGEQLRVTDEIRALCAAVPGLLLENQYGPTESHVVTRYTMTGDPAAFPALPPIGTPVDGAEVLVLDRSMRPVPAGVTGELYLGGVCLADGYTGRPDLTGERFVPHPWGGPEDRLYRTGDLGFALPDGSLVCAGRVDSQVKVRGFRVEPAEVEIAITRFADDHPGIVEAAVVARGREGHDSFLAAYLVGDPDGADPEQLLKQLRSVLPEYLVPTHVQWVAALPLTPSGKRDDAALRGLPLVSAVTGASEGAVPPRDAYEKALVEMVGELLGLPAVGVYDNLFGLGATSLTAMRLVVLIEQRYGVGVPLSEFVAAPTVAALAARLRGGEAVRVFDPLVPLRPGDERQPLFLVHPMGGNVLCYVRFAAHLPPGRACYALQAAGVEAGTEPRRTLEEIAAGYVERIRRVQPEGPYLIAGWSFGGFVAFEMARQLRAAGQEIGRLILLDTTALNPGERPDTSDEALLGWFFWELLWLRRGGDSPQEVLPPELTTLEEKFAFVARLATEEGVLPEGATGAVVRRLFQVYEANWRAASAYRPEAVDQDMALVHAMEPLPAVLDTMHTAARTLHRDPANGWRERTQGELTVVDVPGDHLTIMEDPQVAEVARVVVELIGE